MNGCSALSVTILKLMIFILHGFCFVPIPPWIFFCTVSVFRCEVEYKPAFIFCCASFEKGIHRTFILPIIVVSSKILGDEKFLSSVASVPF